MPVLTGAFPTFLFLLCDLKDKKDADPSSRQESSCSPAVDLSLFVPKDGHGAQLERAAEGVGEAAAGILDLPFRLLRLPM